MEPAGSPWGRFQNCGAVTEKALSPWCLPVTLQPVKETILQIPWSETILGFAEMASTLIWAQKGTESQ